MMKKLALVTALGLACLGSTSHAATATGNFNVTVNLTPLCTVDTTNAALTFAYTSLTGTAVTPLSTFTTTCTNHVAYSISTNIGTEASGVYSTTDTTTNLAYTVTLRTGTTTAGAAVASNAVRNGTGAAQDYALDGNMALGQAGQCGTTDEASVVAGVCGTSTTGRTITLTY
jgi:hypothetical protein